MIRHILFWNYSDEVKKNHKEKEALEILKKSIDTMDGKIDGLLCIEMEENLAPGYDLVFYTEFRDEKALKDFQNHPLHVAHKERCKEIVQDRLCGDIRV